ncbi:hypothetical protein DIS18_05080 [Algibacter marinivivus]|uniref:GH16 domain-containing protein n=1 Tax=Algibacter marinivivus TaxID=2100723 RepID=A0A2U2X821_9FLAO|nr:family 16 glycosylhydrolase [Algibacter marinivivus]PWH83928.1 hypothetical protein DIS18_05080 [Algibacter marinivivus]
MKYNNMIRKVLLLVFFTVSLANAQATMPIDFESPTTWGDFDGGVVTTIANPQSNTDNNSANVGRMVKSAGETWGGSSLILSSSLDFANNDTFTMKAYAVKPNTKVLLKVEVTTEDPLFVFYEQEVTMNTTNAWETLTFDFSGVNSSILYDKIVVIFDNGIEGDGSTNFTFYIDDIVLSNMVASCSDGIQNGDETGVDCGGTSCVPCAPTSNLLTNGDFEAGPPGAPWTGNAINPVDDGSGSNFVNQADVAVAGNPWDVALSQGDLSLTDGASYTFSFDAYTATGTTRSIIVGIGQDSSPFAANVVTETLTDVLTTFTYTLDANYGSAGSMNSRVIFDMGADTGFVFIDNVSLQLATPPPAACSSGGSTGALPGVDYVLVWADEFDIDGKPCPENWGYDIGAGGWGNGESQYYTSRLDNAYVDNGLLTIKAKKENFNGSAYTSARLLSKDKFEFTYGKIDIRAKLPIENGTWSALWMLGADFPDTPWPATGEIDIMEHTGNNENFILGTVHNTDGSGGSGSGSHISMPTPTDFHNYSIIWEEGKIEWFVDDVLFYTYNPSPKTDNNYPYTKDFFLIMNVAMGGTLGQGIDPNFTDGSMVVDYVRVYQKTQPLTEPIASAPSPTINESNVLSAFSDAYPTNRVSNFNFLDFNGTGNYSIIEIESNGNETGKLENLSYYGAKWDAVDVTAYTHVHFDYWTYDSKAINFFLIDKTAGFAGGEPEEPRYSILDTGGDETIVYSQWQSVFIPLQHFLDYNSGGFSYDLNDIHQYKFDGNGTVYIDNVYFTNGTSLSTTNFDADRLRSFPNPTQDYWFVKSKNKTIELIEVFDIFGKQVTQLSSNSNEVKLDVSNLQSGVYFAKIKTDKGNQNLKFIKK